MQRSSGSGVSGESSGIATLIVFGVMALIVIWVLIKVAEFSIGTWNWLSANSRLFGGGAVAFSTIIPLVTIFTDDIKEIKDNSSKTAAIFALLAVTAALGGWSYHLISSSKYHKFVPFSFQTESSSEENSPNVASTAKPAASKKRDTEPSKKSNGNDVGSMANQDNVESEVNPDHGDAVGGLAPQAGNAEAIGDDINRVDEPPEGPSSQDTSPLGTR